MTPEMSDILSDIQPLWLATPCNRTKADEKGSAGQVHYAKDLAAGSDSW